MFKARDQRGGVLSKIFIIPAGVVVLISVFLLGYFMGRGQDKQTAVSEKPPALPEVVSQYLPKKEDFTFYKTLTEKGEKNVSVDLKPGARSDEPAPAKKDDPPPREEEKPAKKPSAENATQKSVPKVTQQSKQAPVQTAKKDLPEGKSSASRVRYTVQVAAYPDRGMAEEEVRGMKRRGYAAFVVATNLADKQTWYRVRVGSFANREAAEKLAGALKTKEGIAGFITTE